MHLLHLSKPYNWFLKTEYLFLIIKLLFSNKLSFRELTTDFLLCGFRITQKIKPDQIDQDSLLYSMQQQNP